MPKLTDQMQTRVMKYTRLIDRQLSAAAYILRIEGLKEQFGLQTDYTLSFSENGKPFLTTHPEIHFSLSHSGNASVCVLSDSPVGVDIEDLNALQDAGFEDTVCFTMNSSEQEIIRKANDRKLQFLIFWTQKEALLKLSGKGIRNNMRSVLEETIDFDLQTFIKDNRFVYSIAQQKK